MENTFKAAVRYYSRSGNTKAVAENIAKVFNVEAVSVDSDDAGIKEYTDILFIGGGYYASGMDMRLRKYLHTIPKEKVGKVIAFSTSWISRRIIMWINEIMTDKGIPAGEDSLYIQVVDRVTQEQLKEAEEFAYKIYVKYGRI